jgi:hypothetical protein
MRIAHVVVAAATIAGRGQFFWGPGRARTRLAGKARLGGGSLPGAGVASSAGQPLIGARYALWPACPSHKFARAVPRHLLARPFYAAAPAVPNIHC